MGLKFKHVTTAIFLVVISSVSYGGSTSPPPPSAAELQNNRVIQQQRIQHEEKMQTERLKIEARMQEQKLKAEAESQDKKQSHERSIQRKEIEAKNKQVIMWISLSGFGLIVVISVVYIMFKKSRETKVQMQINEHQHVFTVEALQIIKDKDISQDHKKELLMLIRDSSPSIERPRLIQSHNSDDSNYEKEEGSESDFLSKKTVTDSSPA